MITYLILYNFDILSNIRISYVSLNSKVMHLILTNIKFSGMENYSNVCLPSNEK